MQLDRITEAFRQIAPGNARTVTVEDRLDEKPIVACGHADRACPAGQQVLDPVPLVVSQPVAAHRSVPSRLTTWGSKNTPRRNGQNRNRSILQPGVAIQTHRNTPQFEDTP